MRELLERERRDPDPYPPLGVTDGIGADDTQASVSGTRDHRYELPRLQSAIAQPNLPEPVLARSTTGLVEAVKAEVARQKEHAALEEQRRANAPAIDDAEAEIERLTGELAEQQTMTDDVDDIGRIDAGDLTAALTRNSGMVLADERRGSSCTGQTCCVIYTVRTWPGLGKARCARTMEGSQERSWRRSTTALVC